MSKYSRKVLEQTMRSARAPKKVKSITVEGLRVRFEHIKENPTDKDSIKSYTSAVVKAAYGKAEAPVLAVKRLIKEQVTILYDLAFSEELKNHRTPDFKSLFLTLNDLKVRIRA